MVDAQSEQIAACQYMMQLLLMVPARERPLRVCLYSLPVFTLDYNNCAHFLSIIADLQKVLELSLSGSQFSFALQPTLAPERPPEATLPFSSVWSIMSIAQTQVKGVLSFPTHFVWCERMSMSSYSHVRSHNNTYFTIVRLLEYFIYLTMKFYFFIIKHRNLLQLLMVRQQHNQVNMT